MAHQVLMPKWGLTMKTGKIARWLVAEGASLEAGQPLLEVETDKITNVVESPAGGVLFQIIAPAGEVVPVKQVIGIIADAGETPERVAGGEAPAAAAASTSAAPAAAAPAKDKKSGSVRAMPAARRVAKELGIDLATVTGTGPDGTVTEKDVRSAAEKPAAAAPAAAATPAAAPAAAPKAASGPQPGSIIPMAGIRQLIATNMQASLQNAAQLTVFVETDVTEMVALREAMLARNKKNPEYRLSYNDIIAYAVCRALLKHPIMNSTLEDDGIHVHEHVNLGVAVSLPDGLIVPNVKQADTYSLEDLKAKVRDAAGRARKGGLSMDEIGGGTFTISNVSMLGVDGFTPILNPPETGILGVGRVVEKPGISEGAVCIRKFMTLSLTFNHMVTDGGPAMTFLRALADMLEKPVRMLA